MKGHYRIWNNHNNDIHIKTKLFSETYHWHSTNLLYSALSRHCIELALYKYSYSFIIDSCQLHNGTDLYYSVIGSDLKC